MTALITLTVAGADSGPYNLFSNLDGYTSAFATNVSKASLLAGYSSSAVPDYTTIVRIVSIGDCTNYIDITLTQLTTTSTSSTTTTTTTGCLTCCDVTIGTQIWTSCNLDITTYRDGTEIPWIPFDQDWRNATTGAWSQQPGAPLYGKLYNWYAINGIYDAASLADPLLRKEFAPVGYHIPSRDEWNILLAYLGGYSVAGGKMKETTILWDYPNVGATNSSGFTGLPGGYRGFMGAGTFTGVGTYADFWALGPIMSNEYNQQLNAQTATLYYGSAEPYSGLSVRLIKD